MLIDLENLNPGTWFDMTDEVKVCLRVCDTEAMRKIRLKTTTKKNEFKKIDGKHERFTWEESDDEMQMDMIYDYCIVDWEGIIDKKTGLGVPCNSENKKLLMGKHLQFAKFISDSLDLLRRQIEGEASQEQEEPEKNC